MTHITSLGSFCLDLPDFLCDQDGRVVILWRERISCNCVWVCDFERHLLVCATVGSPWCVSSQAGLADCDWRRESLRPEKKKKRTQRSHCGSTERGLFIHLFIFNNICLIFQSCEVLSHSSERQELMYEDYYKSKTQTNCIYDATVNKWWNKLC